MLIYVSIKTRAEICVEASHRVIQFLSIKILSEYEKK